MGAVLRTPERAPPSGIRCSASSERCRPCGLERMAVLDALGACRLEFSPGLPTCIVMARLHWVHFAEAAAFRTSPGVQRRPSGAAARPRINDDSGEGRFDDRGAFDRLLRGHCLEPNNRRVHPADAGEIDASARRSILLDVWLGAQTLRSDPHDAGIGPWPAKSRTRLRRPGRWISRKSSCAWRGTYP